jgi:hypothetical protein
VVSGKPLRTKNNITRIDLVTHLRFGGPSNKHNVKAAIIIVEVIIVTVIVIVIVKKNSDIIKG